MRKRASWESRSADASAETWRSINDERAKEVDFPIVRSRLDVVRGMVARKVTDRAGTDVELKKCTVCGQKKHRKDVSKLSVGELKGVADDHGMYPE